MNLFMIAWRNLQHRRLASLLTLLSMALGVALVVLVLSISHLIQQSFQRNSNVGYNLVIGPKGGSMQLTLSTVFYIGSPLRSTLPYSYYLEYLPKEKRLQALEQFGGKFEDASRDGRYSMFVGEGFAIPICMGDYVGKYRIIGTTTDYLTRLHHGDNDDKTYEFAQGRNFQEYSEENGYFEAVLGSIVAQQLNYKIGDIIFPTHGPEGEAHSNGFTVVGILKPTGTPNDRIALINMEGFYLLEGHVEPERDEETGMETRVTKSVEKKDESEKQDQTIVSEPASSETISDSSSSDATMKEGKSSAKKPRMKPLPIEQRQVSAVLLRTGGPFGMGLQGQINKSKSAQAVSPIGEISGLLDTFVLPAQIALLALTILVCIVSAISILVSIYNSMNERTRDIAVMRALGASRDHVLLVILFEALLIAVGGGFLGWFAGHAAAVAAGPAVEARTGIQVGFLTTSYYELWIIPGLIVIGVFAGLLPAIIAYRTDVSRSLAS